MTGKKPSLGRGLAELSPLLARRIGVADAETAVAAGPPGERVANLPLDLLQRGKYQPRSDMRPESLAALAESIKSQGLVQPILVRPLAGRNPGESQRYEIIAGERRWRAAQMAGIGEIPAVIRDVPDEAALAMALIENIQREDLNPIETALAFDRLTRELRLNHEEIGRRTGKDRSTIANLIRLLQLPPDIQQLIAERRLSASNARCLLGLPTPELQREVAEKAVAQGWSVRQVERLTQRLTEDRKAKTVDEAQADPNVKAAIHELERVLGTKVRITERARQKGRIEIEYYSPEDLDRIYSVIVGGPQ